MIDKELIKMVVEIAKSMETDPEVRKKIEECRRLYGTLTAEDLSLTMTI